MIQNTINKDTYPQQCPL